MVHEKALEMPFRNAGPSRDQADGHGLPDAVLRESQGRHESRVCGSVTADDVGSLGVLSRLSITHILG
jgi:hypothetical protein